MASARTFLSIPELGANSVLGAIAVGLNGVYAYKCIQEKNYTGVLVMAVGGTLLPIPAAVGATYGRRNEIKQWIYAKPYQLQNPNSDKRVEY
jgi:hypothetical protein